MHDFLTLASVARGDWALADRFWHGGPARMLACTGSRAEDLWFGVARLTDSLGYHVLAYEIEGFTGHELLRILQDEVWGPAAVDLAPAVHKKRRYLISDGSPRGAAYATERTLYLFVAFCCVDNFDGGPTPSDEELIELLLEQLPRD